MSLLSLETDGTWHDLDVLKVAGSGATRLVGSVADTSVEQVASSTRIAVHRRLLTRPGLGETCRECSIVEICGGGSVPHRFGGGTFDNPTVYCGEMKSLVAHVRSRLAEALGGSLPAIDAPPLIELEAFELAETSVSIVRDLRDEALVDDVTGLRSALIATGRDPAELDSSVMRRAVRRAGTVAWQRTQRAAAAGRIVMDVDGTAIQLDAEYLIRSSRTSRVTRPRSKSAVTTNGSASRLATASFSRTRRRAGSGGFWWPTRSR